MEKKEVPQDEGIYGQWHGINYVTNESGRYETAKTAGWEPTNIANEQVWELVEEEIAGILDRVRRGEMSPLAYHMARHLMDVKMISKYTGLPKWRIKRHLKPRVFEGLDTAVLERYGKALNITVEQLRRAP